MTELGGESEFERARRIAEERALVESAKRGSRAAFETLYRNHVGKVYGLSLPAFESRSAFGTWLHRIAVNAVLAQGRRRSERLGTSGSAEDEAVALPDPSIGDAGTVLDLEAGLRRLPAGARQALVLVGLYGYSHEEAAELLGVAVGTCKSQVHRARQLLGERLAVTEGVR